MQSLFLFERIFEYFDLIDYCNFEILKFSDFWVILFCSKLSNFSQK